MTAFDPQMDDALAAWPIRGLARRFPAKDLATLKTLLQEYAYRLPGDLPHGVQFVRAGGPDDDFYMATDGRGGFWVRDVQHAGFSSRRDLFGALAKCANQGLLPFTQDEEYALESLWHEIWHNRQAGADGIVRLEKAHPVRLFAETLNQVVARLTYPRFVEKLGGVAVHQAWVVNHGYGYLPFVSRFLRIVASLGLDIDTLTDGLTALNRQIDLMQASRHVAALLAKRSGTPRPPIQAALDMICASAPRFEAALKGIKSPF